MAGCDHLGGAGTNPDISGIGMFLRRNNRSRKLTESVCLALCTVCTPQWKQTMPKPPSKIDIMDLISLVCLYRKEAYIFERHLALLTFGLWVIEPNDLKFVKHSRLVGAAQIVKSLVEKRGKVASPAQRRFLEKEFSADVVASALLSPPVIGPFNEEIEHRRFELELAGSIAETFLCAPNSKLHTKRPSLNKAIHFIAKGGYGPAYKFAPATVKKQWVNYVVTAPFLLTEYEITAKVIGLAPDKPQWLKSTNALLKQTAVLREYFDVAKSIQEAFLPKLDPVSRQRFDFVQYPPQTKSTPVEFEPFSDDQLKIYQSYLAPKY
jgi:hypothetical protein